VASGGNAALLIQDKPNIFQQRLANIPQGEEAYVRIELSVPLKYDNEVFELAVPTMVAARYQGAVGTDVPANLWNPPANVNGQRIQFNVVLHTGYELAGLNSPTHPVSVTDLESVRSELESRGALEPGVEIPSGFNYSTMLLQSDTYPNKDFVLRFNRKNKIQDFSVSTYMDPQNEKGFFSLSLYPDPSILTGARPDLEIVMLVDISGSQGGWPLQKEKEICNNILTRLHPEDKYTVISFNNSNSWAFGHSKVVDASEENIVTALNFINGLNSGGGTNLLSGIQAALSVPLESEKKRIYVFLTDGFISNESAIFEEIRNHASEPTIFTFGAGNSLNRFFLDEAAKIGNGFSTIITENDDLTAKVDGAWSKIESPQLSNLSVSFGSEVSVTGLLEPLSNNLYIGGAYSIYGKYTTPGPCTVVLTGYMDGEKVTISQQVNFSGKANINKMLPQIWAKETISRLRMEEGTSTINKGKIIQISENFQVLSKYTAFLAISPTPVDDGNSIGDGEYMTNVDLLDNLRTALSIEVRDGYLWVNMAEGERLLSVYIYGLDGKFLFEWSRGSSTTTDNIFKWDGTSLNGSMLPPGRYLIRIVTNLSSTSKTFMWSGR